MLLRLKCSRPTVEVYVPADELLEHFSQAEPRRRERFIETIRKSGQTPRYPDEEVLKHLLAFALVQERELHFWNWRRYVLEQPRLWDALAGREAS